MLRTIVTKPSLSARASQHQTRRPEQINNANLIDSRQERMHLPAIDKYQTV
jgi:hypothetical protein